MVASGSNKWRKYKSSSNQVCDGFKVWNYREKEAEESPFVHSANDIAKSSP